MAYGGGGMPPMGNAGAMAAGFHNVTVSWFIKLLGFTN
jgi:hypothetical protein